MAIVSAVLCQLLSSRLVKPILSIDKALGNITEGDYHHRLEIHRQDELGDLARKVNLLARSLEKNLNARQQWIAEISHELRTPIAVLRGEIETLQDGLRSLDSKALDSLHAETMRLNRLINDLHDLNLSDLGALSYSMQLLDIKTIIDDCISSHAIELKEKNLSLTLENQASTTQLFGDHQRLTQLFHNLMQNSIRYTNAGGSLDISMACNEQGLLIKWADSAPSVSKKHLPRLFDPLYRTDDSRNREFGGSGLGLAITQKIVQAHEGTISADESEKGGLCISIQLPQAKL